MQNNNFSPENNYITVSLTEDRTQHNDDDNDCYSDDGDD